MTSRTRLLVLALSTPVILFAVVGGYLGQAMTRDTTYQHLRVFEDVVSLVLNNYVEEVDVRDAMRGAMIGLADGLDADSSYLTPALVKALEANEVPGPADVGLEVTRQYYLRVISARDGSPSARAGLRTGDYVRAIDGRATRDMSAYEGNRLLHGSPGSTVSLLVIRGNAADPHEIELVRERRGGAEITSRMADASTGYVRIVDFSKQTPVQLKQTLDALARTGARRYVIDLRSSARGDLDEGIAAARLFVKTGTLAVRQSKGNERETIVAQPADGAVTAPVALLTDTGTSGAAEVFAAALDGNDRATLVGGATIGRAARQRLVKLPDGSGLWLSHIRYLTPAGDQLHEKGLEPDIDVDQPDVEFGSEAPTVDATLQKALELFGEKKAA
ncbi:MAG: S41 family peptidase [Vicinamibacterales bacterium]